MSGSISVAVRVRPPTERERNLLIPTQSSTAGVYGDNCLTSNSSSLSSHRSLRSIIRVLDQRVLIFDPPESNPLHHAQRQILARLGGGKKVKDMRFCFDRVFDETATQEDVYEGSARELVSGVLDGYNATVFAYGATGCGKTHTITGTPEAPGIVYLLMKDLFDRIAADADRTIAEISISYLEIYNETIRDLLNPSATILNLREANSSVSVPGLSTMSPKSASDVISQITTGNSHRTVHGTEANAVSSRSHAVLSVNIRSKPRTAALTDDWAVATLSVIDLAGSERAAVTRNKGERLLEGANINKSLLALGNCINALCDPKTKSGHVPYRNSKLTRLLKHSLGGNCRTLMIVCVAPTSAHYDETHNTLQYANRAKDIKTKVTRNVISVDRHVSQYVQVIYQLRQELEDRKNSDAAREEKARKAINLHHFETESAVVKARKHWEDYMLKGRPAAHAKGTSEGLSQLQSALSVWNDSISSCAESTSDIREALNQEAQSMLYNVETELRSANQVVEEGLVAKSMYDACVSSLGRNVERNLGEEGKATFDREAVKLTKEVGDKILDSAYKEGRANVLSRSIAQIAIWLTGSVNHLSMAEASEEFRVKLSEANKVIFESLTSPDQGSSELKLFETSSLSFSLPLSSLKSNDSKIARASIFSSNTAQKSSNSPSDSSLIARPSKSRRSSSISSPSKSTLTYFAKRASPRKQVILPGRNSSQAHHPGILKTRSVSGPTRPSIASGAEGNASTGPSNNGSKSAGVRWRDVESDGDERLESFDQTMTSAGSSSMEDSMLLNQSSTLLNLPSLSIAQKTPSINKPAAPTVIESSSLQDQKSQPKSLETSKKPPVGVNDSSTRSSRMKAGYLSRNRAQKPPSTLTPLDSLGEEEEGDMTVTMSNSKDDLDQKAPTTASSTNPFSFSRPPLSDTANVPGNETSPPGTSAANTTKEKRRDSLVGPIRKVKPPRRASLSYYKSQTGRSSLAPMSTTENESIMTHRGTSSLRASRVPIIDGNSTESGNLSLSPRKLRNPGTSTRKLLRRSLAVGGSNAASTSASGAQANLTTATSSRPRRISLLPTPVGNNSLTNKSLNSSDRSSNGNSFTRTSQPIWR